jgi:hypothetical protein
VVIFLSFATVCCMLLLIWVVIVFPWPGSEFFCPNGLIDLQNMLSGSPFLFLIGVQGIKCSEMLLLKLGSNFILFYCGVLKYHFDWSSLPPQKITSVQVLEPSVPEFVIGKIGFCAWKVYTLQPNNIQRPKREEGAVGTPSPTSASSRPNGDGLRPLLRSHSHRRALLPPSSPAVTALPRPPSSLPAGSQTYTASSSAPESGNCSGDGRCRRGPYRGCRRREGGAGGASN